MSLPRFSENNDVNKHERTDVVHQLALDYACVHVVHFTKYNRVLEYKFEQFYNDIQTNNNKKVLPGLFNEC